MQSVYRGTPFRLQQDCMRVTWSIAPDWTPSTGAGAASCTPLFTSSSKTSPEAFACNSPSSLSQIPLQVTGKSHKRLLACLSLCSLQTELIHLVAIPFLGVL